MVLPPYDVEVVWGGAEPCLGDVHMDGWGIPPVSGINIYQGQQSHNS